MDKSKVCSGALRTVGTALIITPIIAALPNFIISMFSHQSPVLSQEYGVASGLLITAGFILILYASVEKFREGYRESMGEVSEPDIHSK